MSRNDAILYSGANSTPRKRVEDRRKRLEEKQEKQRRLLPVSEDVFNEIEKLKEKNRQRLITLVNPNTPDDNVQAILLGVRFNEEDLVSLQNTLKTVLRTPATKQESFDE